MNSDTRNERTKATLKCYECEGMGHFARECPTRQRRKEKTFDSREGGIRECAPDAHVPPTDPNPQQRVKIRREGQTARETNRGEKADSSFHLSGPDNAVKQFSVSVLLEQGAPTISVEIGVSRRLILDTGSNVSILQPRMSTGDVKVTLAKQYGVTGEDLDIKGQQSVSFTLNGREYSHTFLVSSLPHRRGRPTRR